MNKKQTEQLEDAISHIQAARALLTEYSKDSSTQNMVGETRHLTGSINGIQIEILGG